MRFILTLLFVIAINSVLSSQNILKFSNIENSNFEVKFDTIFAEDFDKKKVSNSLPSYLTKDSKGLLKSSLKKYKKVLIKKDSCLILKTLNQDLKLCQDLSQEKSWQVHNLIGFQNDYLIFLSEGFEWWQYTLFNPKTKHYFLTENTPNFISKALVYSYGNYYAEGQFELLDINNNKQFSFDTYNWEISSFYRVENEFYSEFTSNTDLNNKKYIKITY